MSRHRLTITAAATTLVLATAGGVGYAAGDSGVDARAQQHSPTAGTQDMRETHRAMMRSPEMRDMHGRMMRGSKHPGRHARPDGGC